MSGKIKLGLEYAGWDTDIFDNDTKIDELIDSQGWIGFSIYFYLCQKAYGSDGYYYRWSYNNAPTTARKMGGGVKSETVKQVVGLCLRIGLFDDRLFDRGILTSRGIQKRYVRAIEKRSKREINPEYWLLSKSESGTVVVFPKNDHSLPENEHSQYENGDSLLLIEVNRSKYNRSSSNTDDTAENPFGNYSDNRPNFDTVEVYVSNNISRLGMRAMQELESFKEDLPEEIIRYAVDEACDHDARNWAYVKRILNDCLDNGYRTVGDIEAARAKKKSNTSNADGDTREVVWRA